MENAAEALKMAFGYILFVLALSISISSFSNATKAVNAIIQLKDKSNDYSYIEIDKQSKQNKGNRIVSAETIVPTLYKAYKENFRVEFRSANNEPLYIYTYIDPNEKKTEVYYIDLEKEILSGPQEAIDHLNALLNKPVVGTKYYKQFTQNGNVKIGNNGLYSYLKEHKFIEVLGEYYQEDKENMDNDTLEINKTKKRLITYILQN